MKWNGDPLESRTFINEVEKKWNVSLPLEFVEIIRQHNSGDPENNIFLTNESKERVFGQLLDFNLKNNNNVSKHYSFLEDILPKKTYPFAIDPAGNYICFDYKDSKNPQIIFWHHEGIIDGENEIHKVEGIAKTFNEFLNGLYKIEDSDTDLSGFETI